MRGDFTRDTRGRAGRTATRTVLLEQGRPLLDADVNEQAALVADRSEAIVRHVVGLRGVPRDDAGFSIAPSAGGFTIGTGSLYAEGLPLANRTPVTYDAQLPAGILPALATGIADGTEALVYVEAVLRPAIDSAIAEPALDGVDTAVREVAGWVVRTAALAGIGMARADLIEALDRDVAVDLVPWRGTTGGLDAGVDIASPDPGPCEIAPGAGYLDQLNRLYRVEIHDGGAPGTATFKWTEDAAREAGLRVSGAGFAIDLPIARAADWFPTGAIVEVIDDNRARAGLTGQIGAITSAPGAQLAINGVSAATLSATIRIRRWAALPAPVLAAGAWSALSKGIRIRFSSGNYQPGAAWTIPARTVLGDIAWPPYLGADKTEMVAVQSVDFYAPMEGKRYHAALALVRRNGNAYAVTQDLRDLFPPLTDITADAVRYDDSTTDLGASDVQQAIEQLVRRGGDCCTWHAKPATDLQALVDAIPARASGTLCLATGNYRLTTPLRIAGKGDIRLVGSGPGTKLWCRTGPQAVIVSDCTSIEILDMVAAAEAPGAPAKLGRTAGAIDIADSGPVRIERATVMTRARRWRQSVCVRVACSAKNGGGDVTIRDCDVVAGDLTGGILVTNPNTARIEDNRVRVRNEPINRTLDRWSQDKVMAAAVGRLAVSFAVDRARALKSLPATRIESRLFRQADLDGPPLSVVLGSLLSQQDYTALRQDLAAAVPANNARAASLRVRQVVGLILPHAGKPVVKGRAFSSFDAFYKTIKPLVAPSIDTAIVVAGTQAGDVTVSGNSIQGTLRGIRVAVNAGVPQQRLPLGTVRIERNHIRLRVVPTDMVRTGIYVGNSERSWIVDNDIAAESAPEPSAAADARLTKLIQLHFDALYAEGISVVGVLGPLIHLRGNMVRSCPFAFTVRRTQGTDGRSKLWLLQGNYADGGITPYRIDSTCKKVDCV